LIVREADRDHSRARPESEPQSLEVQGAVVRPDPHPPHRNAPVLLEGEPRRDVGVVVQARDHDLVTGSQGPPDRSAHGEGHGRHVLAEGDLVRSGGSEEVGRGGMRLGQDRVTFLAGRECPGVIRVRPLHISGHGIDRSTGDLRSARAVEVAVSVAVVPAGEGGELGPDGCQRPAQADLVGVRRRSW
jgi:hypothetical protein